MDPKYTPGLDGLEWDVEPDEANTKITRSIDFPTLCPFNHKGTFFNGESKIYLTNEKMVETLTTITKDSLNGKKIDILGADCCKMAMIEVCYQVKDFVNYFIGSQNCELKDGWDYKAIFNGFKDSEQTPLQASKMIVDTYDTYYKNHAEQGMYTLSALDLSITDELTKNVDRIATLLKKFMENDSQKFKKNITNARSRCVKICYSPYYTDLDSVYTQMLNEFENQDTSMFPKKDFTELKKLLTDGKEIIKKMVVANSTGSNKKDAKGISIYFPRHKIDESYLDTLFAKETSWLSFLQKFISE